MNKPGNLGASVYMNLQCEITLVEYTEQTAFSSVIFI